MSNTKLECPSCGGFLTLPEGASRAICDYCSREIILDSVLASEATKAVSTSIEETGYKTQEAIREGSDHTQLEIKRLQLTQELSMINMQLSNLRMEKRSLLSITKLTKGNRKQLSQIEAEERDLINRQKSIQYNLNSFSSNILSPVKAGVVGTNIVPTISEPNYDQRSESTTLLIAFFLGIFGAHRFYTGHKKLGWLYLFTFGLIGIGWFIDLILIFTNNYKDSFNRRLISGNGYVKKIIGSLLLGGLIASFATSPSTNQEIPESTMIISQVVAFGIVFGIGWIRQFLKKSK